jgi:hypothetical protein
VYCQHCGAPMDDAVRFCTACGKAKTGAGNATASQTPSQKLAGHLKVMGILWIVYSAFRVLMGVGALAISHFVLPMMSNLMPRDADFSGFPAIVNLLRAIYAFSFFFSLVTAIIGVIAAIGLLQHRPWGRVMGLIAAFVSVLNIPFGTGLAVYTMIILFSSGDDENYRHLAVPA